MFTLSEYLDREMQRYFAEAQSIVVRVDEELITVLVTYLGMPTLRLTFECGSDDDWYIFTGTNCMGGNVTITIPLMPEA